MKGSCNNFSNNVRAENSGRQGVRVKAQESFLQNIKQGIRIDRVTMYICPNPVETDTSKGINGKFTDVTL